MHCRLYVRHKKVHNRVKKEVIMRHEHQDTYETNERAPTVNNGKANATNNAFAKGSRSCQSELHTTRIAACAFVLQRDELKQAIQ